MKECTLCGRCLADHHDACPDDRAALRLVFPGSPLLDRKYHLLSRLGTGGMGAVYEAHHVGLERRVAVKLLHPTRLAEPGARERFLAEARALARLDHPNIVRVLDFGSDAESDAPYLVMELLPASSLAERLRSGPLDLATALPLLAQVASALDHAHQAGILHRDLKASNVLLVTPQKEDSPRSLIAKVVDFGLAEFLADAEATPPLAPEENAAPTPGTLGTPAYLAPEAWRGAPPGPAADVWAFGVLTFFTLTGRLPFPGPGRDEIRRQIARGAPAPSTVRPGLDPDLDAAILAPLQADPEARPARARGVVEGVDRAHHAVRRRLWRQREVPRRLALAGLLGVLGVLGAQNLTSLSFLSALENRLVDARFALASPRLAHREPVLVLLDDATLASDPAPLAAQAGAVGALLARTFAAGARGVAIDLLLPRSWGANPAFSDLVLRHADALVLAAASPPGGPVVGPEVLTGLPAAALGPERARELFGFVEVEEDGDGIVRRARPLLRDTAGQIRPSFAARAARLLHPGLPLPEGTVWIDGTVDWRGFERISFRDLAETLDRDPGRFGGRLVLFGADYAASGDESYRITHVDRLPPELPGPFLQALLVETLLEGSPIRSPGRTATSAAFFLLGTAVAAGTLLGRSTFSLAAGPLVAVVWTPSAFALFASHRLLVPIASPLVIVLLLAGVAAVLRKWFAPEPHLFLEPS